MLISPIFGQSSYMWLSDMVTLGIDKLDSCDETLTHAIGSTSTNSQALFRSNHSLYMNRGWQEFDRVGRWHEFRLTSVHPRRIRARADRQHTPAWKLPAAGCCTLRLPTGPRRHFQVPRATTASDTPPSVNCGDQNRAAVWVITYR